MTALKDSLLSWAEQMEKYKTPEWDSLPDINLYMDQVITWLERQMNIFTPHDNEKLITPAMINNYVKNQVIPRPIQKKYTRDHLAHLITVLNLKQELSLSDITKLMSQADSEKEIETLFEQFTVIQDAAIHQAAEKVKEALEGINTEISEEEAVKRLIILAMKLSLEANSYSLAAKTIMNKIEYKTKKNSESKEKWKDKDKV